MRMAHERKHRSVSIPMGMWKPNRWVRFGSAISLISSRSDATYSRALLERKIEKWKGPCLKSRGKAKDGWTEKEEEEDQVKGEKNDREDRKGERRNIICFYRYPAFKLTNLDDNGVYALPFCIFLFLWNRPR